MEIPKDQSSSEEPSSVIIKGDYNIVGSGNKVIYTKQFITIKQFKEKDLFYPPLKPLLIFNPALFDDIINRINKTRIILLGGNELLRNDKNQFARALAYKLQEKHGGDNLKIYEWRKNTDVYDIAALLTERERGIYLFTELTLQMVQYSIDVIFETVQRKSHFLIITTNTNLHEWAKLTNSPSLIQELNAQMLYEKSYMELNLVELIARSSFSLPKELRREFVEVYKAQKVNQLNIRELVDFPLSPNRTIQYIAKCLRGYDDLDRFVRILCEDEDQAFSDDTIDEIIKKVTSKDWDLLKWYHEDLNKRDRHLLLGMTLLSGLYENQLFVAMEELVENEWRIREPVLNAFDYEELEKLKNYAVDIIETGEIERRIEIKPKLRKHIFNECWQNQRRLIVGSIQGMMNIVKNSIYRYTSHSRKPSFKLTEEAIDKLKQLGTPDYILEVLQQIKDRTYSQWFELEDDLKKNIGEHSFDLFQEKLSTIFDKDDILYDDDDDEFREITASAKRSQLYRTSDKIKLIHRVIGYALRQIAYESLPLAEEALFFYASEENEFMRNLAATSLAQWKNRENDPQDNKKYEDELYQILNRWYNEPEKVFDPSGEGLSKSRLVFIKEKKKYYYSTIMLTIGFAASHDKPNQCSEELLTLLKKFIPPLLDEIEETGPLKWVEVDWALGASTVPLLIKYHLEQLHKNGLLYDMMRYESSAIHIFYELSITYLKNPSLFNKIINRMNEICNRLRLLEKRYQKRAKKLTRRGIPASEIALSQDLRIYPQRERLMSILIATYGSLHFIDGDDRLTAKETFQRLKDIFKREHKESMLRDAVADAVRAQISRDFYNLKDEIRSILTIFNFRHYPKIAPGFCPIILEERKKLEKELAKKKKEEEGKFAEKKKETLLKDKFTEIDEDSFDPERRVTKTEKLLFGWISKGGGRYRLIGFLALFGAYLIKTKKEGKPEEFDELLTEKDYKMILYAILITPLSLFGLGRPFVLMHLLPTAITLNSNFGSELNEMIQTWCVKIGKGKIVIRWLGWALRISLFFVNYPALTVIIYFFIVFILLRG